MGRERAVGRNVGRWTLTLCVGVCWPHLSSGPLQDNSFLIEEAYNQEAGVVQHIWGSTYDMKHGDWTASLTQEWPVPDERHQLSFTVPFSWLAGPGSGRGVGDVLLNYRYQALDESESRPAFAPRLSLILPTGSRQDGLGNGSPGGQTNLPVSKQLNDHWAVHANLGATAIPHALASEGPPHSEGLYSWNTGGSVIWEPWDAINVLQEVIFSRDATITQGGATPRSHGFYSPGVRVGWNGPGGLQWVAGVAVPIGLTRDSPDVGLFLYFSLENAFTAAARAKRQW